MQYGILRTYRGSNPCAAEQAEPRIASYGYDAEQLAQRLPADLPLLVYDGTEIEAALADALRRREAKTPFLVAPLLDESSSILSRSAAIDIYEQLEQRDDREELFASLAEGMMSFHETSLFRAGIYSDRILDALADITKLGNGLFVRSQTERAYISAVLKTRHRYVAVAPTVDPSVPNIHPYREAAHVVVWAPNENAINLTTFSFALWNLHKPAIFVCRGEIPQTPHHFVAVEQAETVLAHASVIVDAQITDPGTAIAFAGRGCGLATALTSGAHEYIQGAATYDMHDYASIADAVAQAAEERRTFALPVPDPASVIRETLAAAA